MEVTSTDYEQLMMLKALTKQSKTLHDAQVYQLKMWPLLLTHAIRTQISVDFDFKDIIFNILETKGRKPNRFAKRLKLLGHYTQTLLGEEYSVTVKLKGKNIYKLPGG